tara:strand:- start:696 stop:1604 length:909 start_codon:yes stop_codon:yes gene_type:complete
MKTNLIFNPLISIIINCHNGEKYLHEALKSILKQTYKKWEVIFWDNKSKDKSKEIFKLYKDKRFKYFYSKKFTSLYKARNLAIKKSKGELISFLDVDDTWLPKKLSQQVSLFKDDKIGVVYSNLYILDQKNNRKKIFSNKLLPSGKITSEIIRNYKVSILTVLIKKKILNTYNLKFNNLYNIIGDFDLMFKLSQKTSFKYLNKPTGTYRVHDNNLTLKKYNLGIEEQERWVKEQKKKKFFTFKNEIKYIELEIKYKKIKLSIYRGEFLLSLKSILLFPLGINKFKLLIFLLFVPRKMLNIKI